MLLLVSRERRYSGGADYNASSTNPASRSACGAGHVPYVPPFDAEDRLLPASIKPGNLVWLQQGTRRPNSPRRHGRIGRVSRNCGDILIMYGCIRTPVYRQKDAKRSHQPIGGYRANSIAYSERLAANVGLSIASSVVNSALESEDDLLTNGS